MKSPSFFETSGTHHPATFSRIPEEQLRQILASRPIFSLQRLENGFVLNFVMDVRVKF
jgi:hypothetical protein